MATRPVSGSRALTFPPVHMTKLFLGSSAWSRHSCSRMVSSMKNSCVYPRASAFSAFNRFITSFAPRPK